MNKATNKPSSSNSSSNSSNKSSTASPSIVEKLPKIGDSFSKELDAFNKRYEEFLPKNLTYDPVTKDFQCGSYIVTVGCDLATLFDKPSTEQNEAKPQQASDNVAQ